MNRTLFLSIAGIVSILMGLGALLAPQNVFGPYGITFNSELELFARGIGAFLFALGITTWYARKDEGSPALQAVLLGGFSVHLLTLYIDLMATVNGVMNSMGWSFVAIHIVFGAGFAYYLFMKPSEKSV